MTYLKAKPEAEVDSKANELKYNKKKTPLWLNERCIQACAWILLTIGLCIIVITFYLAIQQKHNDGARNFDVVAAGFDSGINGFGSDHDLDNVVGHFPSNANANVNDNDMSTIMDGNLGNWLDSNQDSRFFMTHFLGAITSKVIGCQEKLCKIVCSHDGNIFISLFKTMKTSSCPSIDILLMEAQDFPGNMINNSWMPLNLSVYEVVIRASNLTKISSNAFNTPIFMNTFLMSWSNLDIERVESGALLGLYKLKYLTIDSNIQKLESAFFQPVQTTLTHLKLNANLLLSGNRNVFGVSYMNKLEYLDLSFNQITGSLGKRMFSSTPNLKYLIIVEAQVQHIEEDAFAQLSDKLIFVNLSKNQLITMAAGTIEPILQNHVGAMVSLSRNKWLCDCQLQKLSALYKTYRNQFIDDAYCTAPHNLYGVSIDEVDYQRLNCELVTSTTVQGPVEEKEDSPLTTTTTTTATATTNTYAITPPMDFDSSDLLNSEEATSSESTTSVFRMRCVNVDSASAISSASSSSSSAAADEDESLERNLEDESLERNLELTGEADYFKFPPPAHEFDLQLIGDNNSVIVVIEDPTDLMIIWFSDRQEADSVTYNNKSLDYECMRYAQPQLVVGPLVENTTYTFCLVPLVQNSISPFNCLPLHVPLKREENIWISQDHKKFTIGMLCLIFLLSTILGALVAYFGIKTYPDLLEGSKNVLVVKKPDPSCYVATISETEYMKQSSLKKRKPSTKDEQKGKEVLKKQPSVKLPLPAIPFASPPETPPPSFHMSVRNLENLSKPLAVSKGFDEPPFPEDYFCKEGNYETPRLCENEYTLEQRSIPNDYCVSPMSPPPLPKRNSSVSDSPTLVLNRFSRNM